MWFIIFNINNFIINAIYFIYCIIVLLFVYRIFYLLWTLIEYILGNIYIFFHITLYRYFSNSIYYSHIIFCYIIRLLITMSVSTLNNNGDILITNFMGFSYKIAFFISHVLRRNIYLSESSLDTVLDKILSKDFTNSLEFAVFLDKAINEEVIKQEELLQKNLENALHSVVDKLSYNEFKDAKDLKSFLEKAVREELIKYDQELYNNVLIEYFNTTAALVKAAISEETNKLPIFKKTMDGSINDQSRLYSVKDNIDNANIVNNINPGLGKNPDVIIMPGDGYMYLQWDKNVNIFEVVSIAPKHLLKKDVEHNDGRYILHSSENEELVLNIKVKRSEDDPRCLEYISLDYSSNGTAEKEWISWFYNLIISLDPSILIQIVFNLSLFAILALGAKRALARYLHEKYELEMQQKNAEEYKERFLQLYEENLIKEYAKLREKPEDETDAIIRYFAEHH